MSDRPFPHPALQLVPLSSNRETQRALRTPVPRHEVYFASLYRAGHALAFPCDERGEVDIDRLPPAARRNYLEACASVGRDYALPQVRPMAGFTH